MMPLSKRKKWTESEEQTLIDKYGQMVLDGTLPKMKTREKKYKPISAHVNSIHHNSDPVTYPWQWTWKDVSTKVQNMRHQYSLVKQKIKRNDSEGLDWLEGVTHWSNFLRYKEVFGDFPLGNDEIAEFGDGDFVDNGVVGLEFGYDGEENYGGSNENIEAVGSDTRKKRRVLKGSGKRAWGYLRELENRFEEREKEREERERKRREEELVYEREWEERMNLRRSEWRKRIDQMLVQHRVEMGQIQTRIVHEQQNLTNQLLGIFPQWTGNPTGIPDSNQYLSQMMQNLHHENGIVHEDTRVEGNNQEDQFIVDG